MTESRANAEQSDYWNTIAGPKWLEMNEQLDLQLEPYGSAVLESAAPAAGESVLDVGCGCGTTSVNLGRVVGAHGTVLGVDIAAGMIERARDLAARSGVTNVRFECADAQVYRFPPSAFDVLYSRFGVMFFADPLAAFRNLARALKVGGRLAFVCWQPVSENPWMSAPMLAAMQHIKVDVPADPDAPGPFAFGDAERVCAMLCQAGFSDARASELRVEMSVGGGMPLDEALEFVLRISPLSRPLAEVDEQARSNAVRAIRTAIAPFEVNDVVRIPSAAWIVTARRGAAS